MISKILYPTDTSMMSNAGFKYAVEMAKKFGAEITVLNVHEEFIPKTERQFLRINPEDFQKYMDERAIKSRGILDDLIREFNADNICKIVVREGNPRPSIISFSEECDFDLIVMTSNGRSSLSQQVIGSVAEYVVHHSKIPVLVIKSKLPDKI